MELKNTLDKERLKECVRERIEDIAEYPVDPWEQFENLRMLSWQIIGLCDTFGFITSQDVSDLLIPVNEEKEKVNEKIIERDRMKRHPGKRKRR